jgi:hypothetical protein
VSQGAQELIRNVASGVQHGPLVLETLSGMSGVQDYVVMYATCLYLIKCDSTVQVGDEVAAATVRTMYGRTLHELQWDIIVYAWKGTNEWLL